MMRERTLTNDMKSYILLSFFMMGCISDSNEDDYKLIEARHHTQLSLIELLGEQINYPLPVHAEQFIIEELHNPENKYEKVRDTYLRPICILENRECIIYFYPSYQAYISLNDGGSHYIRYARLPSFNKFVNERKLLEKLWEYSAYDDCNEQLVYETKQLMLHFLMHPHTQ